MVESPRAGLVPRCFHSTVLSRQRRACTVRRLRDPVATALDRTDRGTAVFVDVATERAADFEFPEKLVRSHRIEGELRFDQKFRRRAAREALEDYQRAELVVTSRLHAMLPCLAFGTPVVYVPTRSRWRRTAVHSHARLPALRRDVGRRSDLRLGRAFAFEPPPTALDRTGLPRG